MVTIKGKNYAPKMTISVIGRYGSSKKIGLSQIFTLLDDVSLTDLVGLFVFACHLEGHDVTDQDLYDEMDERQEVLTELAEHMRDQLEPKIKEEEGSKNLKAKVKD